MASRSAVVVNHAHTPVFVLFALDAAMETAGHAPELYARFEAAAGIIVGKFLPDLPEL